MTCVKADQSTALFSLLKPGSTVYVGGSSGEPRGLLEFIQSQGQHLSGLHFLQFPLAALNQKDLSGLCADSTQEAFFMSPFLQESYAAGRVQFVPIQMRSVFDYLRESPVDVALLCGARGADGKLRYGSNVDFLDALLASAKNIVLEINSDMIAPQGSPLVDETRISLAIEMSSGKPVFPSGDIDATSAAIGESIATLVQDGDCLQTGIGAVPAAILANLDARSDLGFHGGLIDDGVMRLIENGNMTGHRKAIDKGAHITGMALGSEALFDWLAHADKARDVRFRSADYTHESTVIRQLDNFVSINSAVEIDLMGQVNAEVAGSKQISGTGGSVDFMRAARMSSGGRSIVAMAATARGGSVSRIVPTVSVVTALRTDVDIVVTEFGIARLRNASLADRREQLIAIAHPDFRAQLSAT